MNATETNEQQAPEAIHSSAGLADELQWRVHTYRLLKEIVENSQQPVLRQPLNIFARLLAKVGERAIELNDPKLNALMCRLTIYTVADPESPDYDPEIVERVMQSANSDYTTQKRLTQ